MSLFDKKFRLGVYEKAIPTELSWEGSLLKAKPADFYFVETYTSRNLSQEDQI